MCVNFCLILWGYGRVSPGKDVLLGEEGEDAQGKGEAILLRPFWKKTLKRKFCQAQLSLTHNSSILELKPETNKALALSTALYKLSINKQ